MPAPRRTVPGVAGALLGTLGLSALAGLLVTVMVAPAIAVTGMTANNTLGIFDQLPDYLELNTGAQRNEIVVGSGKNEVHIADIYDQNREEVDLDKMSPFLITAAIDGEDRRFYTHGGVDIPSVARAVLGQATGASAGGGSTITMQLVRNVIVQDIVNDDSLSEDEKTKQYNAAIAPDYSRKLQEMKFAIGLEKRYTKDEILQAYLNIAGFGFNTYGVQAASQQYFSKSAADLDAAEAASIIAIVQQPSKRNLGSEDNFTANQDRRDVILKNMYSLGDLTKDEYDEAINTPVDKKFVDYQAPQQGCLSAPAQFAFACDYAVSVRSQLPALGADTTERLANWKKGGYKIVLTISPSLQLTADKTVQKFAPKNVKSFKNLGAASASVRVGTGEILVMVQNKRYNTVDGNKDYTTTAVNFNIVGSAGHGGSGFQPGSSYKPFVLLAFLNAGHGIEETFNASVRAEPQSAFADSCEGAHAGPEFKFRNDQNEGGLWTVANGTAHSVNSVFVQMATKIDQCAIKDMAASLGVHRAENPDGSEPYADGGLQTNPSCSIGGCENNMAPLMVAAAYAAIAGDGVFCEPIIVKSVIDSAGEKLPGQDRACSQSAASPEVAAAAAYAMHGAMVGSGTAVVSNPNDGTEYIAKTGTTDSSIHTWMTGSSTEVATSVWVGNIRGKTAMRQTYVNGRYGATLRHDIFKPIAQAIDRRYPGEAFPVPDERYVKGSPVTVPDVIGKSPEQAKAAIELSELTYSDQGEIDSDLPAGVVAKISPGAGASVSRGTGVRVWISNGEGARVPSVLDLPDFATAQAKLNAAGFTNVVEACVVPEPTDEAPPAEGQVVAQDPKPNRVANKNAVITVTTAHAVCL